MRLRRWGAVVVAMATAVAACGGDDETSDDEPTADTATDTAEADETAPAATSADPNPVTPAVDIEAMLSADLDACQPAPTGPPIKMGMAADFSEVVGFVDIPGSKLLAFAAELINCIGGVNGSPVEVRIEDVGGEATTASVAAETLVDWGAHFMQGPPFADFALPVLQVTKGGIPLFLGGSTEPTLANMEQNSYLVTFDDTAQATAAAEYALAQGLTRAFVFTQPGPYTGYTPDVFTEVFTAGGGEVVSSQTYEWGATTDFSAQVSELSGVLEGGEVMYSAMLGFQLSALRGQLEAAGVADITYMGTDALDATGIQFEENAEGVIHTPHDYIEPGDRSDRLLAAYAAAKGEQLENRGFMSLYVDGLLLGLQAVANCQCTEPAEIGVAVREIENFDAISGSITYVGTNGNPAKKVPIVQVQNGVDVLLTEG